MAKGKSLGRGLDALFADNTTADSTSGITTLRLFDIEPNREQPRKTFDEEALSELAESIREHGLLQPIVVRPKDNGLYEIIAGERRWRASKIAGLTQIPVIVKELDDRNAAEISLIENLQREDLNVVEAAMGFKALMEDFSLTQEQAAQRVGKSRASVANIIRILALPECVLELIKAGSLSFAHARTMLPLLAIYDQAKLLELAKLIIDKKLSVRETEAMVRSIIRKKPEKKQSAVEKSYYEQLARRVSGSIGRKIKIGSSSLTIHYSSSEDLEKLITEICGKDFFITNE